jgi:hypothetical protein
MGKARNSGERNASKQRGCSGNKLSSEHKYKSVIEYEINDINKTWSDVTKIIKVEKRYER